MSLDFTYDGAPLAYDVKRGEITITARADEGEASFSGVNLEDPTAALSLLGHRPFIIEETRCSQPRLFTGWTTDRSVGRSVEQTQFVGLDARLFDLTAVDCNNLFGLRQISGVDGNRPDETWEERLDWILNSDYLDGLISTSRAFTDTWPNPMDAVDYRGSTPADVLDDLMQRFDGAINYFAFWDPAALAVTLFFDHIDQGIATCALSISNVLADVDSVTVFAPDRVARLTREPDETYSEVTVEYANGKVFRSRPSTAATYIRRGTTISRPYTGKESTATAQAEQFLDRHATELDRITCSIQVPPESVGLIQAGQLMNVKFSHMPGYTDFVSMRIVSCSPKPTTDLADLYDVALELVASRPIATIPSFLIAVLAYGVQPYPVSCTDYSTHPWTVAWENNNIGATSVIACGAGPPLGQCNAIWYRAVAPGESAAVLDINQPIHVGAWVYEVAGVDMAAITSTNDKEWFDDGSTISVEATVSVESVIFGIISWAHEGYDDGWCASAGIGLEIGHDVVIPTVGTELVNASSSNSCGGYAVPWNWIAHAQGTGNIKIEATSDTEGSGAGAYVCGYNTGRGALVMPVLSGASFSIVQSAFGESPNTGQRFTVSLPAPPTGSSPGGGGGSDPVIPLPPTPPPGTTTTHTVDPTVDDDADAGYHVGAGWINTVGGTVWVLVDETNGAAVWVEITGGGGSPNLDGGIASSTYGGIAALDAGGA